eukprot:CAMPEP_0180224186 /NCGR_PEP_ID=MMETSP0987-20121128/21911_1 /TAXON_ID=697907 /ORGANISM="non described non described, Strain CCMP2293" /LENGTH=146 /DNA_ID=CAMNT_0022186927 /DNA_START=23 /DNA_END=463 /DNA_ORIENTATION=+
MCIDCQVPRPPQAQCEALRMANTQSDVELRDFHLAAFLHGFASSPVAAAKAAPCHATPPPTTASKPNTHVATWNNDCLDWDVRDPQLAFSLKDFSCDLDLFPTPAAPSSTPSALPASLPLVEEGVDEWKLRDPQLEASIKDFEFSF